VAVAQKLPRLTEADYLRVERLAETRSEFFDGEMFARAGRTRSHSFSEVFAKVEFEPGPLRSRL
jgi:hypothetical protein